MRAFRFLAAVLLTLSSVATADEPLQLPSWLTPFPHKDGNQIVDAPDHLHISYEVGASSLIVVGHYETVLRQAGVKYSEGPDITMERFSGFRRIEHLVLSGFRVASRATIRTLMLSAS
jgi:hypothetical protein